MTNQATTTSGTGDDAPDREDRGEWQADPIPQRTDSERSDPVAELIEGDQLSCHYGRERGKLITAEADAEWQKRRACEARQPESNYSPGFVLHSGANLKDNNQQDRKRDIDPACRHDPGDERDQHASYRHHRPEGRHREGG